MYIAGAGSEAAGGDWRQRVLLLGMRDLQHTGLSFTPGLEGTLLRGVDRVGHE